MLSGRGCVGNGHSTLVLRLEGGASKYSLSWFFILLESDSKEDRKKKMGVVSFFLSMLGKHVLHTCTGEQGHVLFKTSPRSIIFYSHSNLSANRCQPSFEGLVLPSPISVLFARYLVGSVAQPQDMGNGNYVLEWRQNKWPGAGEIKDPGLFLTSTRCCMHSLLSLVLSISQDSAPVPVPSCRDSTHIMLTC